MALTGTYIKYTSTEGELSSTVSHSITYPANLNESDVNYDKRGTTEWVSSSIVTESSESLDNVYLRIHNYNQWTMGSTPSEPDDDSSALEKENILQITYRLYNSKADAIDDVNNHIYADDISFPLKNTELTSALTEPAYEYAYNRLKTVRGFENLTNA